MSLGQIVDELVDLALQTGLFSRWSIDQTFRNMLLEIFSSHTGMIREIQGDSDLNVAHRAVVNLFSNGLN